MFIYNVTVNVDRDIEEEWMEWMKSEHILDVLNTGRFKNHKMLRLLNEQPDASGNTFAIQFMADELKDIQAYLANEAPVLQQESAAKYGEKAVAFRTVLEEI